MKTLQELKQYVDAEMEKAGKKYAELRTQEDRKADAQFYAGVHSAFYDMQDQLHSFLNVGSENGGKSLQDE